MRILSPLPLLALFSISSSAILLAADNTWTGGTDGNWNTNSNWSSGTPPISGNVSFSDSGNKTIALDGSTAALGKMDFDAASSGYVFNLNNAANLTINGEGITNNSIITTINANSNSSLTITGNAVANNLLLTANGSDSSITISGTANITSPAHSGTTQFHGAGKNASFVLTDNAIYNSNAWFRMTGESTNITFSGSSEFNTQVYLYSTGKDAFFHITDNATLNGNRIFLNGTSNTFLVDKNGTVNTFGRFVVNGTDTQWIVADHGNITMIGKGEFIALNGTRGSILMTDNSTLTLNGTDNTVTPASTAGVQIRNQGTNTTFTMNKNAAIVMKQNGDNFRNYGTNSILIMEDNASIKGSSLTANQLRIDSASSGSSAAYLYGNATVENLTILVNGSNNLLSLADYADISTARVLLQNGGILAIDYADPNYVLADNIIADSTGGTILLQPGRTLLINTDISDFANLGYKQDGGDASISINGTGSLILNQENNVAKVLVASGATIEASHQNALSSSLLSLSGTLNASGTDPLGIGALAGNGTINTNTTDLHIGFNDNSTTFNGTLTGSGNITKVGNGTLTFDTVTATTYNGDIEINLGTLVLKDTMLNDSSNLVINGGSLLTQGSSTIGTLGLKDGTTYSVGATRIGSSNILTPSNTLSANMINIDPTAQIYVDFSDTRAGDQLNGFITANNIVYDPSGDAVLIDPNDSSTTEKLSEIIVLSTIPTTIGFTLGASANASMIDLNLEAVQLSFSDVRFGFNLDKNQLAIADALDSLAVETTSAAPIIGELNNQPAAYLPNIFDQINPAGLSAMGKIARQQTDTEINIISQRLDAQRQNTRVNREVRDSVIRISSSQMNMQIPSSQLLVSSTPIPPPGSNPLNVNPEGANTQTPWSAYAAASASMGSIDSSARERANGYDYKMGGLTIGMDKYIGANEGIAGLQLAYHHGKSDLENSGGNTTVDTLRIAGYAGWNTMKRYWIQAHAAMAYHDYDTSRLTYNGGFGNTAYTDGSTNGYGLAASFEIGKALNLGSNAKWNAGPFARLTYDWLRIDSFTENSGTLSDMHFGNQTPDSLRSALGWKFWRDYVSESGTTWIINGHIAWNHEYQKPNPAINARFAQGGNPFRVYGTDVSRESVILNLGFQTYLRSGTAFGLNYRGEINSDFDEHSLNAFLSIPF